MPGIRARLQWNISLSALFGADEMRPIAFLPNRQRVATGGVSSLARLRHTLGMELSPRNRLSVWWGDEPRPADRMDSKGNVL
jgi:hypothetical protein